MAMDILVWHEKLIVNCLQPHSLCYFNPNTTSLIPTHTHTYTTALIIMVHPQPTHSHLPLDMLWADDVSIMFVTARDNRSAPKNKWVTFTIQYQFTCTLWNVRSRHINVSCVCFTNKTWPARSTQTFPISQLSAMQTYKHKSPHIQSVRNIADRPSNFERFLRNQSSYPYNRRCHNVVAKCTLPKSTFQQTERAENALFDDEAMIPKTQTH